MRCSKLIRPLPQHTTLRDHPRVWLFDLDNTLHDASHAIFQQIDQSMTRAVMQALSIDFDAATKLRQKYWERYGATMIGMQRHHGIDASEFLHMSHDFDAAAYVKPEPHLAALLTATPGIKYVFTNAPYRYARTVLQTLKIEQCFAGICAIDQMMLQGNYYPKPSLKLMQQMIHQLQCKPEQVTLVEDTLKNLKSAKQIGMRCAHIFHRGTPFSAKYDGRPSYVDVKVHSIQALLRHPFSRQPY